MAGADRMTIEEVVKQVLLDEHADVIREAVKAVAAEMMELEVSELIGAERGERRPEDRATHRNGYRPRRLGHRAGEIELQIPKIRQGSYFPSFLEPRRRSEQALLAVIQQATCAASRRGGSMGPERIGPDIFQSSPIMRRGARAPLCVLLTLISMGCSLDSPAEPPPFDPVTRRIDSTLAGESVRHKGADYATTAAGTTDHRLERRAARSRQPPPRIKPPKRSVAPPAGSAIIRAKSND